jgi:hypothetical protein
VRNVIDVGCSIFDESYLKCYNDEGRPSATISLKTRQQEEAMVEVEMGFLFVLQRR